MVIKLMAPFKKLLKRKSNQQGFILTHARLIQTMKSLFFITLLSTSSYFSTSLFIANNAFALSAVTAVIDKNPAMLNESILLTITADDDVSRNALDTSPLLKDFIVGQTRMSSQTSIVNFSATRTTTWQITLIAREAGQFRVPALSIDKLKTSPIELNVIAAKNNSANSQQTDIFITSELSSNEVYVQQSLTLSIKLHFAVELHSASMDQPELIGAIVDKIGEDQQSDGIINGRRYRIIEQTYAITPEQSGQFVIEGPVFSGEVRQDATRSNRRSSFLSYGQTKPVSVVGDDLNINVLPIPANYPNNAQWLPTDILTLHQEWQSEGDEFTVGEPITRTITLTAAGLSKAQLPKLTMESTRGLKIYPDQAELHSNLRGDRLISQKVQNFALVPSTSGTFKLPEMSVTWFNTVTNKIEKATLASRTITVKASKDNTNSSLRNNLTAPTDNQLTNQMNIDHSANQNNAENNSAECLVTETENKSQPVNVKGLPIWFILLWLLTVLAWLVHVLILKSRHKNSDGFSAQQNNNGRNQAGNQYLKLLVACKKNDAEQTLNLVLPWLKQLLNDNKKGVEINNVAQAQTLINNESFTREFNQLQQYLYGKNDTATSTWNGMELLGAIQAVNKQQNHPTDVVNSSSLNP